MACKYLYIDDFSPEIAKGTIEGLTAGGGLEISFLNPEGDWELEYERLVESEDWKYIDGLILDLRLQDAKGLNGEFSRYSGVLLATVIRESAKEKKIKEYPIILFSANDNIEKYFDQTGEDLFDICIPKEKLVGDEFNNTRNKLIALSNGYSIVNQLDRTKHLEAISVLFQIASEGLDSRFTAKIKALLDEPSHIIAKFIISQVLKKEGILISEQLLSAKLGVDREKSKDWRVLLEKTTSFKYNGIFHEGWPRWWIHGLENWWNVGLNMKTTIKSLSAPERVNLLRERLDLQGLVPAEKIEKARSDSFWVVCKGLQRPLDPIDGLIIAGQDDTFPWQEKQYVSFEAAINRRSIEEWKEVAPGEKNKLEQLEKIYSRERIRR